MGIVQKETLVFFFYTRMPRETARQRGKKLEDARKSRLEQASSSVPKVEKQTDVNGLYSLKASPATKAKFPCLLRARWTRSSRNYRHHPVCHGYKSRNRCICGYRCLFRHADGEKKSSARSRRRRRYSRRNRYSEKKKSKVVYLKTQIL